MRDQILPTSSRPSSCHGGKIVAFSHVNNLGPNKKEMIFISSKGEFNYLTCSRRELEGIILRYTSRPSEISREILGYECTLDDLSFRGYLSYLCLNLSYVVRSALDNERHFFPAEGKIRKYLGHFMAFLDFL